MKKYFILLPLILTVIGLTIFGNAYKNLEEEKVNQKYQDINRSIDLIAMQIKNMKKEDNLHVILEQIKYIDLEYMVYAALFDSNLTLLSERVVANNEMLFNPFDNNIFIEAINKNNTGELILPYDNGINKADEMHLYYTWVYTLDKESKFLLISATSEYSITPYHNPLIIIGIAFITFPLILLQICLVFRVSHQYSLEKKFWTVIKR